MKTINSVIVLLLFSITAHAQQFVWAKGSRSTTTARTIIKDGYVAGGSFSGTASFGSTTVNGSKSYNPYLAKFNIQGECEKLLWCDTTVGNSKITCIGSDAHDNIYVTGWFRDSLKYNGQTIKAAHWKNSYFIFKIDSAGNLGWIKTFLNPGVGIDTRIDITSMRVDQDKLYVCGNIDSTYTVDGITVHPSDGRAYFAQLSASTGQMTWARQALYPQLYVNVPRMIFADDNHNVTIVVENVNSAMPPTYVKFGQDTLFPQGKPNYIVQYDVNGNYNFSAGVGDSSAYIIEAVASDGKNIYIGGRANKSGSLKGSYLLKVDSVGNQKWKYNSTAESIYLADRAQALYILFQFRDSLKFNNLSMNAEDQNFLLAQANTANGDITWRTKAIERYVYTFQLIPDMLSSVEGRGLLVSGATQGGLWLGYSHINDYNFTALIADTIFTPAGKNTVTGNVFKDADTNCINNNETGLPEFGVIATPGPYFAVTDAQGNYKLKTDTGRYNIQLIPPTGRHFTDTLTCVTGGHNVNFTGTSQTQTGYDFPNKFNSCAFGMIRGGQSDRLWCNKNVITHVLVSNISRDTMFNYVLTIKYPGKIVSPIAASIAWTSYSPMDSTMTFNLPAILPDSALRIEIVDFVQCPTGMSLSYYDTSLSYYAKLTPLNICYPEDSIYNYHTIRTSFGLSVATAEPKKELTIYPNPTTGHVYIKNMEGAKLIEVYNVSGQRVFRQEGNIATETNLDLSKQAAGLYLVLIRTDKQVITGKIMKQ